jgi:hypothetical protein
MNSVANSSDIGTGLYGVVYKKTLYVAFTQLFWLYGHTWTIPGTILETTHNYSIISQLNCLIF